jgi:hypothetical protein
MTHAIMPPGVGTELASCSYTVPATSNRTCAQSAGPSIPPPSLTQAALRSGWPLVSNKVATAKNKRFQSPHISCQPFRTQSVGHPAFRRDTAEVMTVVLSELSHNHRLELICECATGESLPKYKTKRHSRCSKRLECRASSIDQFQAVNKVRFEELQRAEKIFTMELSP